MVHEADHTTSVSTQITIHQALNAVSDLVQNLPVDRLSYSMAAKLDYLKEVVMCRLKGKE